MEPLWTFPGEALLWVLANWMRLAAALPGQNGKKNGKRKKIFFFPVLDVSFPDGPPEEVEDLEGNNIAAVSDFSVLLALIDCIVAFCPQEKKNACGNYFAALNFCGVKPTCKANK